MFAKVTCKASSQIVAISQPMFALSWLVGACARAHTHCIMYCWQTLSVLRHPLEKGRLWLGDLVVMNPLKLSCLQINVQFYLCFYRRCGTWDHPVENSYFIIILFKYLVIIKLINKIVKIWRYWAVFKVLWKKLDQLCNIWISHTTHWIVYMERGFSVAHMWVFWALIGY